MPRPLTVLAVLADPCAHLDLFHREPDALQPACKVPIRWLWDMLGDLEARRTTGSTLLLP